MPDQPEVPFTLLLETSDPALAEQARRELRDAEVSASSNFIGGTEIAAFFSISTLKSLRAAIAGMLAFTDSVRGRHDGAKVVIGKDQISLEGFGRDDVERLLSNEAFRDMQARIASSTDE
ncbi:MAG TPA: hypothetical protein VGB04_13550 [Allosphingosinicella sp.]|jgi:hypothetical protein